VAKDSAERRDVIVQVMRRPVILARARHGHQGMVLSSSANLGPGRLPVRLVVSVDGRVILVGPADDVGGSDEALGWPDERVFSVVSCDQSKSLKGS